MSRISYIALLAIILIGCKGQTIISGPLNVPDALLSYSAEGQGDPLVIFTGGENLGQKFFPKELKENFIVIHADPSKIDSSLISKISLDDILDDLERLRVSIGVEKIGILGHSMFGLLPLEYAVKYPDNISYAISTGSSPFNNQTLSNASSKYWESKASDERKNVRKQNWEKLVDFDWNTISPTQRFIKSYLANTPFRFYDPGFDQSRFWEGVEINMNFLSHYGGNLMKDFDNTEAYKDIKSPVLVISGKYDFGTPYYLWEDYHDIIPKFTHKVYENAGHNPFMEIPEEFAKDVLKWVKSID